ncbi:DNA polymerase III subunit gamma/tau [Candidatus Omnitrophota bacterium]
MSYLVFARKWRPKNFDEIIGQNHIATTLKNAISLERLGHAYLFSGPRGIGKTSTARILAKAINCEQGLTASPCNRCSNCLEIADGRSLDVIEIDGASNRGIEQIRQLRENVKFSPAKSRAKIYIIDEVHQITTDGFNALLKTLEEPPAHVKFIFATTQAHKVLATILSRCQRFEFKPLAIAEIIEKLRKIIKQEKLDVSEQALLYIARAASGSMRDAESILDQLSSFCKGKIELDTVTSILGMVDFEALWQVSDQIIERNAAAALTLTEEIINEGKDLSQFLASLLEHFRNILVTKTVSQKSLAGLIDLPQEFIQRISQQAEKLSYEEVFYIFNILLRAQEHLRRTLSSRVIVEMAIVKLSQRENLSSLQAILSRLSELEKNMQGCQEAPAAPEVPTASIKQSPKEQIETPAPSNPHPAGATLGDLHQNWMRLLETVKKEKVFVASVLEFTEIVDIKGKDLLVALPPGNNFHKETLENGENKSFIEAKTKEIFGRDLKLKFVSPSQEQTETPHSKQTVKDSNKQLSDEPIVKSALKMFQGRIIRQA